MIEAHHFVEAARERGFRWYAGVPCSYLTPFINFVLQDPSLQLCVDGQRRRRRGAHRWSGARRRCGAPAGGLAHGRGIAMMQNSGLGNAVSPLTSLTWTFRLPQLLIVTWRGQPGIADEPQHALMGPITPALLDTMEIPWELFPTRRSMRWAPRSTVPSRIWMRPAGPTRCSCRRAASPPMRSSSGADSAESRCKAARTDQRSKNGAQRRDPRDRMHCARWWPARRLRRRCWHRPDFAVASCMRIEDRPNQFYMVGSMGCVVPFALGLAMARPDARCARAGRRRRRIDEDGCARDRGRIRPAQPQASVAGQWRARFDRRSGNGIPARLVRGRRRCLRLCRRTRNRRCACRSAAGSSRRASTGRASRDC